MSEAGASRMRSRRVASDSGVGDGPNCLNAFSTSAIGIVSPLTTAAVPAAAVAWPAGPAAASAAARPPAPARSVAAGRVVLTHLPPLIPDLPAHYRGKRARSRQ